MNGKGKVVIIINVTTLTVYCNPQHWILLNNLLHDVTRTSLLEQDAAWILETVYLYRIQVTAKRNSHPYLVSNFRSTDRYPYWLALTYAQRDYCSIIGGALTVANPFDADARLCVIFWEMTQPWAEDTLHVLIEQRARPFMFFIYSFFRIQPVSWGPCVTVVTLIRTSDEHLLTIRVQDCLRHFLLKSVSRTMSDYMLTVASMFVPEDGAISQPWQLRATVM